MSQQGPLSLAAPDLEMGHVDELVERLRPSLALMHVEARLTAAPGPLTGLVIEPMCAEERALLVSAWGPSAHLGMALFVPTAEAAAFVADLRPAAVRAVARISEQAPAGRVWLLVLTSSGGVHTMTFPVGNIPVRGQA